MSMPLLLAKSLTGLRMSHDGDSEQYTNAAFFTPAVTSATHARAARGSSLKISPMTPEKVPISPRTISGFGPLAGAGVPGAAGVGAAGADPGLVAAGVPDPPAGAAGPPPDTPAAD